MIVCAVEAELRCNRVSYRDHGVKGGPLNQQNAQGRTIVLVDEDITYDKRVQASLAHLGGVEVIVCTDFNFELQCRSFFFWVGGLLCLFSSIFHGFGRWRLLRQHYGVDSNNFAAGLLKSFKTFILAQQIAHKMHLQCSTVCLIYAHDLFCGIIGAELSRLSGASLIYDAHEVEFHRNRKNSWLRTAYDMELERHVINRSSLVKVVSTPIALLYQLVYALPAERLQVVDNNHFLPVTSKIRSSIPSSIEIALVYVGGGVKGRQLEQLTSGASALGVPVYGFFINEVPKVAVEHGWFIGCKEYEGPLISLAISHRCMMWCCVDNICLSYQLALPNKFYQALAVGIPVIASCNSYLSDIINKHNIGAVFDGTNLKTIITQMRSSTYTDWLASIVVFNKKLQDGDVVL